MLDTTSARADGYRMRSVKTSTLARQAGFSVIDWRCPGSICDSRCDERTTSYELIFTRSGSWIVNGSRGSVFVDAGHVLLRPPDLPFRVSHPTQHGDSGIIIAFGRDLGSSISELAAARSGLKERMFEQILVAPVPPQLYMRHHILAGRLSRGFIADPLEVEANVLELLAGSFGTLAAPGAGGWSGAGDTHRRHLRRVQDAKSFLAERFRENITLAEVANAVGVSPFHFARLFKRYTGTPVHRYLTKLRLVSSFEMILDSGYTLSRVAFELGFSSHSHFTEAFRKEFHTLPSQARRAVNEGMLPR